MDETEIEGKAFGLGGRWKRVKDDISTTFQDNQTLIIQKNVKKQNL